MKKVTKKDEELAFKTLEKRFPVGVYFSIDKKIHRFSHGGKEVEYHAYTEKGSAGGTISGYFPTPMEAVNDLIFKVFGVYGL